MGSYFVNEVTVIDVRPSVRGAGLVDLAVTLWRENALPGAERPWESVRTGQRNGAGMRHELGLFEPFLEIFGDGSSLRGIGPGKAVPCVAQSPREDGTAVSRGRPGPSPGR
ncbi:hypothetical protein ACFCYC_09640 [Streptomyces sp. NPDC056402]|uniref:hypothetical protein n=1 Tax=Streptomyces sp. NPDC056402 TaxID=3345810 RepID=UPI0035D7ECE2